MDAPVIVRYMTPREEELYSNWRGFAVYSDELEEREIALRREEPSEALASTLAHEMGHIKYPVVGSSPFNFVGDFFSELCANYYEAMQPPANSLWVIEKIVDSKDGAEDMGLSRKQIARLDKLARTRVGYTGERIG